MKWIARHPKLSAAIIAIIVLFAFIFISSIVSKQDNAAGRAAGTAIAAIQKPFILGLDWLGVRLATTFTDDALRGENERLRAQVEELENDLVQNRLEETELEELRQLRDALAAAAPPGEYELRAANILVFEGSNIFNIFTIDAGLEDGVSRDTVVVSGGGLAGRVLEVNDHTAKVIAIIDENNTIGFMVEGRPTELGLCRGNGRGSLSGEMLGDDTDVRVGDRVVTSGLGSIYPAGILIGTVTSTLYGKESSLLQVEIEPVTDFRSIRKVVLLL